MVRGDQPVRRVTIVGGGTAGWMTAAVLSQWLSQVEITLVESEEIGTIGVGEATIPHIRNYLALAGIDALKMISETKATFKLGIQFVDWGAPGESYIHGFGKIGRDMLWLHPHQLWLAARERAPGSVKPFDHYSIAGAASLRNRFAFPDKRNPNSPIADLEYAYHFDASLFARFLRAESEARGVMRVEGRIVETLQDSETGFVTGVRLQDGRELDGDLFVDCSGMRALLIGDAARRRLRTLEQVADLRSRTCRSMRERLAAHPLRAVHDALGRLAMAHPAAAQDRQWLCLFVGLRQRRRSSGIVAVQSGRRAAGRPAACSLRSGSARKGLGEECRRDRAFVRIPGATGIDEHPPDPDRHPQAPGAVPRDRILAAGYQRI